MRRAGLDRLVFVTIMLAAALPSAGQAQLGGLKKLKAKVEKAVGSESPQAAAASPQPGSPYGQSVLEITDAVAACFERALAAENAELDKFRAWASGVKSEDAYEACQGQVMMSPAAQEISRELAGAADRGQQAAVQAMQTAQGKLSALTETSCGPQPNQVEQRRRAAQKAAQASGMAACGYTESQYHILKERVVPICRSGALASADGALKLPGAMAGNSYVYSAAEVAVFKARCSGFMSALQKQL